MKFIFLYFILIGSFCMAQSNFYISPSIATRTGSAIQANASNLKEANSPFPSNEYFTLVNRGRNYSLNLNYGIHFGWKKGQKMFEFGVSSDNVSTSKSITGFTYNFDSLSQQGLYTSNKNLSVDQKSFIRFSFLYGNEFYTTKNDQFAFRYSLGAGIFFTPGVNRKKGIEYNSDTLQPGFDFGYVSPSAYVFNLQSVATSGYKFVPYLKFGLGTDLYSKKGTYFLSIDISYLTGLRQIWFEQLEVAVNDSGQMKYFNYNLKTRGAGFEFQLSRKLNFNAKEKK